MDLLMHWLTIPVKVIVIAVVSLYHRIKLRLKYGSYIPNNGILDIEAIHDSYSFCFHEIQASLSPGPTGQLIYDCNPDHQALRNGSLAWAAPTPEIVNGMENYIVGEDYIRGPNHNKGFKTPPASPMAVAHAITSLLENNLSPSNRLKAKFLASVDKFISTDFIQDNDTTTRPRAFSTAFDAFFSLCMLYTAHRLSMDSKYLKEANNILYNKGYAILLLAPMTFVNDKRRDFFKDHIALYGLRTAILNCPEGLSKGLLRHAYWFIHSQCYVYGNPYLAAMALECEVLPEHHRKLVLDVHSKADPITASIYRKMKKADIQPSDFTTHSAGEFMFDELQGQGVELVEDTGKRVWLNGLTLARSLEILYYGKS